MTSDYVRVTGLADLFGKARELSVQTMIFDVEPLVAPWNSSQEVLDQGSARPAACTWPPARRSDTGRDYRLVSGRRNSSGRTSSPQ